MVRWGVVLPLLTPALTPLLLSYGILSALPLTTLSFARASAAPGTKNVGVFPTNEERADVLLD